MTLTELRYVTVLAKVQHFGRAAEQCNVSQPTLSIAVKKLESELGVEIFERTKSLVRPTPVGEKIVQQSRRVLEESAVIKDLATLGKDQLSVPLHVGAIFTIGPYLFPSFIPKLQNNAPDMPLIIEEGYTSSLRQRLRKCEVDVIIVALPLMNPMWSFSRYLKSPLWPSCQKIILWLIILKSAQNKLMPKMCYCLVMAIALEIR